MSLTSHLFNTTGSGKTRLCLEGLCHNWGFYFSCVSKVFASSGSRDVELAIDMIPKMNTFGHNLEMNVLAADITFHTLLCARLLVFQKFMSYLPPATRPILARRRWVFLQLLPPIYGMHDIFVHIQRVLRHADPVDVKDIEQNMLTSITEQQPAMFPRKTPLFVVIDEAQAAARCLRNQFPSTGNSDNTYPVLHELYRVLYGSEFFQGTVLSGTGLSLHLVLSLLGSFGAKRLSKPHPVKVFSGSAVFSHSAQVDYAKVNLALSEVHPSDRRLLQRMERWLLGRCVLFLSCFDSWFTFVNSHRLTASLVEICLHFPNAPLHRILSKFIQRVTGGFKATDAEDLEREEAPISQELDKLIECYGTLISDHIFSEHRG
jgi:hypothetical protein